MPTVEFMKKRLRGLFKLLFVTIEVYYNYGSYIAFYTSLAKSHKLGWTLVLVFSVRKSNPLYGVGTSVPQLFGYIAEYLCRKLWVVKDNFCVKI